MTNTWRGGGIDSSAFANPANFATHAKKYQEGLTQPSASLLNPKLSIFQQIHNKEEGGKKNFQKKTIEGDTSHSRLSPRKRINRCSIIST